MTAFVRSGIDAISLLQVTVTEASCNQALVIAEMSCCFVVIVWARIRRLTMPHNISIGLQSGLLPGQSRTGMLLHRSHSMDLLEVWQGAPSCMKVKSPSGNQS